MSHRTFGGLRGVMAVFALVLLAASCDGASQPGDSSTIVPSSPTASTAPTPSPTSEPGDRSGTLWPIKHVVFLVKANRTFDNLFGTFPGADGVSFGFDDVNLSYDFDFTQEPRRPDPLPLRTDC